MGFQPDTNSSHDAEAISGTWRVRAYFLIEGFSCAPDDVTARLNTTPTRTWSAGDAKQHTPGAYAYAGWRLDSGADGHLEPGAHLDWLLEKLPRDGSALDGVGGDLSIAFRAVIEITDRTAATPPLYLSSSMMKRLADWDAAVDLDLFI